MDEERMLIMVAGYRDLAAARSDFAELRIEAEDQRFELRAAVLLTNDPDGTTRVIEIGNDMGDREAGRGVGVGVLMGLFAPPLLFTVAADAALATLVGRFADDGRNSGLHDQIGQALAAGTGVVIAVLPPASQVMVQRALAGCPRTTIVGMAESTIRGLEATVVEEMREVAAIEAAVDAVAQPARAT